METDDSRFIEEAESLTTPSFVLSPLDEERLAQEAEWVQRASQGDRDALVKLYERYIDRVYRYCYSKVRSVSDAEEVTSETFTRAIEQLMRGHYAWQGKPFGAWLFAIANNVSQERKRQWNAMPFLEDLDAILEHFEPVSQEPGIPDVLAQQEEWTALWQLVRTLPIVQQRVVILRHAYGLSYAEIAQRLKRSEKACKQLHYRALTKLKRLAQETDL